MISSPSEPEALRAAGFSVLPAARERKRPTIGAWKQYQTRVPSAAEVAAWFASPQDALCLICGRVSGNLECIDFDSGGEAFPAFQALVDPGVGMKLVCERTQSGGVHVFYRCATPVDGNQKLAMSESGNVLVETRGEGGLVLCAPSDGYEMFQGGLLEMPVLTTEERAALLDAARSLDRHVVRPPARQVQSPSAPNQVGGHSSTVAPLGWDLRPGEDYDARGDLASLLESHGWTRVHGGANEGWKRPGKDGGQQSATWNGTVFYVFSSNAQPFEPGRGYGKFGVFALLECGGDYQAATELLASRGYGRPSEPVTGVDTSAVIGEAEFVSVVPDVDHSAVDVEEPEPQESCARVVQSPIASVDWALYSMPGFVDSLAAYTLRVSPYSNKALAFSGALSLLCFLCGRVYCTATGLSPLLYVLALAGSAVGKEAPRSVNKNILAAVGLADRLGEEFASGEGLEDSLLESPSMLYQSDEIAFLFENLKDDDVRARSIATKLLRLYSSSSGIYSTRVTARRRASSGTTEKAKPRVIVRPLPVIYGSATPEKFYGALTRDLLENGLVGRCIVLDADAPRVRNRAANAEEPPPAIVFDAIEDLRRVGTEIGDGPARPVAETEDASSVLAAFADECDERVNEANAGRADIPGTAALWGRAWEKTCKLALLRAVSRSPGVPCIEKSDAEAAVALVRAVTTRLLSQLRFNLAGTPFEKSCSAALRYLGTHGAGVSRTDLTRTLRLPKRTLDEVIGFLIDSGQVVQGKVRNPNGANRSSICYKLVR